MYFVYLTTNLINGKQYVGSHEGDINDPYLGSGIIINKTISKHGKENFKREILKITESRKEAYDLEEPYIKEYNTLLPNGYNISPTGGMNEWGGRHSEETKKKLSEKRKGREPWNKGKKGIYSDSTLKKMSENTKTKREKNPMFGRKGKNSPIYGIKKTKDHKDKMSKSKKGGKNPNAVKYKIITPDNKKIVVNSATEFIEKYPEYKINRHFIYNASKKEGYYKKWLIEKR